MKENHRDCKMSGKVPVLTFVFFSFTIVLLWGCHTTSPNQETEKPRPNIIVMYSDDHTAQAIGAYREALNYGLKLDHTPTPNIDRLAEGGMRFDNAFVTNSICAPSRAVMLSGLHSHKNGVMTNAEEMPTDLETFPVLLQRAGYQTAIIGKWHLKSEPRGFDYYEVLYGQGPYYNPTMRTTYGDVSYRGYTTEIITDIALRWLRLDRERDRPFLMIYNHKAPHREWLPGPEHLDDYRNRNLPEPSTLFYDYSGLSIPASENKLKIGTYLRWGVDLKVPLNPETGEPNPDWQELVHSNRLTGKQLGRIEKAYAEENEYLYQHYDQMSTEERLRWRYQRYIKDYLRVVRGVDDGVGQVMAYLERENLLDNTVVIYAGDQGFYLGEKGWFDKRWIYDVSMRMPLIVYWPAGIDAGLVDGHLVQNLDFAPTILELAGIEIPQGMQGRSMAPLLKGEDPGDWRDAIYYHYHVKNAYGIPPHYGVRTHRYTLVYYPEHNEWELFDLEADPEQLTSVHDEPEYSEELASLKIKLSELRKKYNDHTLH